MASANLAPIESAPEPSFAFPDYVPAYTMSEKADLDRAESPVSPAESLSSSSRNSPKSAPGLDGPLGSRPKTASAWIVAPTPTPWDKKRAVLAKQQPLPQLAPPKATPNDAADGPAEPRSTAKLRKGSAQPKDRRNSLQVLQSGPPTGPQARQRSPNPDPRGRSVSAQPSPEKRRPAGVKGVSPVPPKPRPASSGGSQSPTRGRLRRSWLPGPRSRSSSRDGRSAKAGAGAWILTEENQAEYWPGFLKNGEKVGSWQSSGHEKRADQCIQVPELWNESASVSIYLHPRGRGLGPSFRVPLHTIHASVTLMQLCEAEGEESAYTLDGRGSSSVDGATRLPSPSSVHNGPNDVRLYIPPPRPDHVSTLAKESDPELERLVNIRNLFAFLTGQPLVATKNQPTILEAFLNIADLLREYNFLAPDGASFGEHVDLCFSFYLDKLHLADCRTSPEKTVEALVLGERMRSEPLYNEAYAHAVGKYSAIMELRLPLYGKVSRLTRQRLERAHLDLTNRQHSVNEHLEQFEFPALFSGIASSQSLAELKHVRFKVWRNSFHKMRHLVLHYYKSEFGNWPPKARSKKNPFAESGLNRIVLKILYKDMCDLYDLLVDRTRLTTRVMDHVPQVQESSHDPGTAALHTLLSEFDRSKPPVLPPVPFDLPRPPTMAAILETYPSLSPKEQAKFDKKIKDHELELVLNKAYNYDVITRGSGSPFLDEFRRLEFREAKGKTAQDLVDQRIGYWIFLYVVIQSLPMLVVDAPDLKYTGDVEYFLCEPPMGNLPWMDDTAVRKMWFGVAGGGGVVELSADTVMFGVEGIYHRSHCWLAAKNWDEADGSGLALPPPPPVQEAAIPPLEPPPHVFQDSDSLVGTPPPFLPGPGNASPPPGAAQPAIRPRHLSPSAPAAHRSSIALGLEPVPFEPPYLPGSHYRSSSIGPRAPSSCLDLRSSSVGDLAAMSRSQDHHNVRTPPAATTGATFDDILGSAKEDKKSRRKSKFF